MVQNSPLKYSLKQTPSILPQTCLKACVSCFVDEKTARAKHSRYSLKESKRDVQELYVRNMKQKVARNASLKKKLVQGFKKRQQVLSEKLKPKRLSMAVVSIGVRRVLNTALKRRKANSGEFLA